MSHASVRRWLGQWEGFLPPGALVMVPRASEAAAASAHVIEPAPAPAIPAETRSAPPAAAAVESLEAVRAALGECQRCKLCSGRTQIVFGEGNPRARLMFVGEGPGEQEDASGRPFVGKAGQLLTKMIEAMGLSREEVYIANVVKCRPPENRNPELDEIAACEPFLKRQIAAIRPEVIVALGKFAAQTLTGTQDGILRLRGRVYEYEGARLVPTLHPAYLLRNPSAKRDAWEDLKKAASLMGHTIPARGKSGGQQ